MHITMNDNRITGLSQLIEAAKLPEDISLQSTSKAELYQWLNQTFDKFRYRNASKKERGIVLSYAQRMTGLSRIQLKKLVRRKQKTGRIEQIRGTRHRFPKQYEAEDIARLIETDQAHGRLNGHATKAILVREYAGGNTAYERISRISVSHLYNLRETRQYQSLSLSFTHTKPVSIQIGIRKKPQPNGIPGYIRVDSVHQGDLDKVKGVYHINLVDEVSQWELVGCVEGISEYFLEPLLKKLLASFPFVIKGFHSDNGSEYINKTVAKLLAKLLIEQTKSRSRCSTDNGLVEGKNASVIRKNFGHAHIPRRYASLINEFDERFLNLYLNFHHPCGFATDIVSERGKVVKRYDTYLTPLEKLQTIPEVEKYLKTGINLASLGEIARKESDNQCAERMRKAKIQLGKLLTDC